MCGMTVTVVTSKSMDITAKIKVITYKCQTSNRCNACRIGTRLTKIILVISAIQSNFFDHRSTSTPTKGPNKTIGNTLTANKELIITAEPVN